MKHLPLSELHITHDRYHAGSFGCSPKQYPMPEQIFQSRITIPTTMERIWAFHEDPKALSRLTPFPIIMRVHRDERSSLSEGELEFTLWFGPIPARWIARHETGPTPTSFVDRMVKGPMRAWRHEHIFQETAGGIEMTDRITYEHRPVSFWGVFTRIFFSKPFLAFLFFYRHQRTKAATRSRDGAGVRQRSS
jgi:hypothetical protein